MRDANLTMAFHRLYRFVPQPPSTNLPTQQLTARVYDTLPDGATLLDIGGKNGTAKQSPELRRLRGFCLDIQGSDGVDVVGDAHALPFASESVDAARCVNVLAHCKDPWRVLAEVRRVLKPGGLLYLSDSFVFRTARDPVDYYRFSTAGLANLCSGFEVIQSGFNRGPASSMADMLAHFGAVALCFNSKPVHDVLVDLFRWGLFPLKYLDRLLNNYYCADVIYNGAFFYGRKPGSAEPA
jgi:SAM-dependent methyltransferase